MKQWYNHKTEENNTVPHQQSAAFNIGTLNSAILNSATINITITTSATATSAM